jgi:WD40 repeat protein
MRTAHYDVFLSHNSADKVAVEELARRLVKAGMQPWFDAWNLIPGDPWQEAIEGALAQCASCAVFIGPSSIGPWQNEEMCVAIDRRVHETQGTFRVIPVLLPSSERGERSRLPDFLVRATWVEFRRTLDDEDAFRRLVAGIRGREPGPGPAGAIYEGECPYRGLQFFDVQNAGFFFGREALTEWLIDALRPATLHRLSTPCSDSDNRFLAIIGPSGSGKSSLARAGLIAALQHASFPGSATWPIIICRPGAYPLESLAVHLVDAVGAPKPLSECRRLIQDLEDDERTLHLSVRLALRESSADQRLVLLVDQFEEVFTVCQDEAQCRALIANLLYAASVVGGQTIVVLTMRADFYGRCADLPLLAVALSDHQVLVGSMSDDEIRRAIERPAQLSGLELEPGLTERLLEDVRHQPGGLPLLQHALLELWKHRRGGKLAHKDYDAIGGVAGALEKRAEEVYSRLDPFEKDTCRRIFLRLTQPGEGTEDTKRRASLGELLPADGNREGVEAVVQALASPDVRLITTEGEGASQYVEVAHEALISGWTRLRGWIELDRDALRIHRKLTEAATEWETNSRSKSYLYGRERLQQARKWVVTHGGDMSSIEKAFVEASLGAEKHNAFLRQGTLVAVTILIFIALMGVISAISSVHSQTEADERTRRQIYVSRTLAELEKRPERAWLLTLAAILPLDTKNESSSVLGILYRTFSEARVLQVLSGHNGEVTTALLSPDGKLVLTTSEDGVVRIRELASHSKMLVLDGHQKRISVGSWSPDGQRVLTASFDGTSRVWDARTGEQLLSLQGHSSPVVSAAWGPDGQQIATGSWDHTARIWDANTGVALRILQGHASAIQNVAWCPEGRLVLTSGDDGTGRIWDAESGQQLVMLRGHTASIRSMAWSPNGTQVVTTSEDETARIWDARTGVEQKVLRGHRGYVLAAAWNPVSNNVLTAGEDGTARVWDVATGEEVLAFRGHSDAIWFVAWSPNGQYLATGSADSTVRVWRNERLAKREQTLYGHSGAISSLSWSEDGRRILTGGVDGTARVWEATNGLETHVLRGHTGFVFSTAWSPNGKQILTGSWDGTARLWDMATGENLHAFEGHTAKVVSVAWSPEGQKVLTGSEDGTARIWDASTGPELRVLKGHLGPVRAVAFSSDGKWALTGGDDKSARLWNTTTGDAVHVFSGHTQPVTVIAWQPTDRRVLTSGSDGMLRIWDIASGNEVGLLTGNMSGILVAAWSPDQTMIAAGCTDGSVHLWNTSTLTQAYVLRRHTGPVYALAWSPDGRQVITAGGDGTAWLWDRASGTPAAVLHGHTGYIFSIAWNPDGQTILTGSDDGTARLWDRLTGDEIARLGPHGGAAFTVAWSPNGELALTSSDDNTGRLWLLDKVLLVAELKRRVCALFSDKDIELEVRNWRGCQTELAEAHEASLGFDELRR